MPADRRVYGRVQRLDPDGYRMLRYGRLHELFDSASLTPLDRLVVYELLDLVHYVTDETTGTLSALADYMGVGRKALAVSMGRLQALGWVDVHFPKGHAGTVRLLIADAVMRFSPHATTLREDFRTRHLTLTKESNDACGASIVTSDQDFDGIPSALAVEPSGCATGATRARGVCSVCDEPSNPASAVNGRDYCIACEPF